uniref:GRF-type domain-containing protein n=1 Tax=Leersia perrieri TaxID=77586 RepID=A0A0D9XXS0_9ORYZ
MDVALALPPLVKCPRCSGQVLRFTSTTPKSSGRRFYRCEHQGNYSRACTFWRWEEQYISWLRLQMAGTSASSGGAASSGATSRQTGGGSVAQRDTGFEQMLVDIDAQVKWITYVLVCVIAVVVLFWLGQ